MFALSAGFADGKIVGRGPVDTAIKSTETGSLRSCLPDHVSGDASG